MTMTVKEFNSWLDKKYDAMRNRVRHKKNYKNVSVCRKWSRKKTGRKRFKEFAIAEYSSLPFVKLGLDPGDVKLETEKDIYQFGQAKKVYSSDTVCFVPAEINDIIMGVEHGKGYSYSKDHKKYRVTVCVDGKRLDLGYYDAPEQARRVYLRNRADYLYSKALEYSLYMTDRTFRAIEAICKSL